MKLRTIIFFLLVILFIVGCGEEAPVPTVAPAASLTQPTEDTAAVAAAETPPTVATIAPTAVPLTPTPTEPLAALVNGESITLAAYEKELARYEQSQASLGTSDPNYRATVLDALITQQLVSQAAAASGVEVTDAEVDETLESYRTLANENGNFDEWLAANLWTEDEYREVLAAEIAEAQMVDLVTGDVPRTAEQVHARYLQVGDPALAEQLLTQIRNGDDFAFLAQQHSLDRLTGENGGDIGYFAQGSLLVPELETAAFALQPGDVSEVIAAGSIDGSETVYYLIQVIERDPQRPLSPDFRYELLQQTFQTWLDTLWQQADIERFVE
ncbi:MAG: SurA N-terminal domain-containing protein [Anaerolineales bacterium]|nr:SurA N-terminal domain-containing protein [Anaerolineales bacterium]